MPSFILTYYIVQLLQAVPLPKIKKKISLLQKKAIINVSGNQFYAHANPLLIELEILPYPSHIQYAMLLFMHSTVYKYCPKSLLETWQTNTDRYQPHELRIQNPFP
jgi:hypothetical protein